MGRSQVNSAAHPGISRPAWLLALLGLAAAAAAGLLASGAGDPVGAEAKKKKKKDPNVVVVMTDDQTVESMRVMETVNSEIGGNGVTFANHFTNWAVCCPSRATFLTGQYSHNHGVRGNTAPDGGFGRFNNNKTLATWLQQAGYHTVHIGKFLNGYGGSASGAALVPPGWSEWYAGTNGTTQLVYDYTLNENGNLIDYGTDAEDFKQDVLTDRAVEVIDRRAPMRKPFFVTVAYTAPHGGGPNPNPQPPTNACQGSAKPAPRHASAFQSEPLPQPPNFNEADVSDKPDEIANNPSLTGGDVDDITTNYRCRLASLLSVDEGVGEIMDALGASGELDNTLVVYTSDNGFFHGEHRVKNGKTKLYEPSIRVPLLMRGPGIPSKENTVEDLTINADVAPTIVKATGADPNLTMDGRSLRSVARHSNRVSGRAMFLDTKGYKAVRTERYLYAEHSTNETEMYDLEADPFELQSVHADPAYAKPRSRLAKLLNRLRDCSGKKCSRGPKVKLKLKPDKARGQGCRQAPLKALLRGKERKLVDEASFRGAGKSDRDRKRPFKFNLSRSKLKGKGKVKVKATVILRDGRRDSTLKKKTSVCG